LIHLRNLYELDAAKFTATLDSASEKIDTVNALVRCASRTGRGKIFQYGQALAGSFFADIGRAQFVKSDVHVVEMAAATLGLSSIPDAKALALVQQCVARTGMMPRAVDKLMYLAGSSNFYLYGERLPDSENVKLNFRLTVAYHCDGTEASKALAAQPRGSPAIGSGCVKSEAP